MFKSNYRKKAGLNPGSIVFTGDQNKYQQTIKVIDFDENSFFEFHSKDSIEAIKSDYKAKYRLIHIQALKSETILEEIGKHFDVHILTLEDIANTDQRPKLDILSKTLHLTLKLVNYNDTNDSIFFSQVNLILGNNFLLLFQEDDSNAFDFLLDKLKSMEYKKINAGIDFLFYSIIDTIIDNYFITLDNLAGFIDEIEEKLLVEKSKDIVKKISLIKRNLIHLHRAVFPLREVIRSILRLDSDLLKKDNSIYYNDLFDHCLQVTDNIDYMREMTSTMLDVYLTHSGNKLNEIMKLLTIISTIFIPLTFLAGVYGMNFKNMPELEMPYGYSFIWIIFILISTAMIIFFKRKKWL